MTKQKRIDLKTKIEAANQTTLERLMKAEPLWEDVRQAIEVIPGLGERTVLHSGPPISWERMARAQKNAVLGAIVYEGWSETIDEAEGLITRNEVDIEPCHHYDTVGSMIGVTSPSMPVHVVRDQTSDYTAYCLVYEGGPKGMSRRRLAFGANDAEVIENLRWIETTLGPALGQAVRAAGGVPLKPIIAKALGMGDEMHSRNTAASALTVLNLAPHISALGLDDEARDEIWSYLNRVELFFLALSMAACKSTAEPAHDIPYSTIAIVLCRNGVDYGVQVSGLGRQWFTGPAQPIEGMYFAGYKKEDGCPDVGDSAITEAMGLGAFAMASAPALVQYKGGQMASAIEHVRNMGEIAVGRHQQFLMPTLDNEGTPLGVDIRRVVETGITPLCDTGIAHREGGQMGFGTSAAPMEAFELALKSFAQRYPE